jgi:hypothetical protein
LRENCLAKSPVLVKRPKGIWPKNQYTPGKQGARMWSEILTQATLFQVNRRLAHNEPYPFIAFVTTNIQNGYIFT